MVLSQLFWWVSDAQVSLYSYNRTDVPTQFVGEPPATPAQPPAAQLGQGPLAAEPVVSAQSTAGRRLAAGQPTSLPRSPTPATVSVPLTAAAAVNATQMPCLQAL